LTPIHSALDRECPRMDRDLLLQPVQKPEVIGLRFKNKSLKIKVYPSAIKSYIKSVTLYFNFIFVQFKYIKKSPISNDVSCAQK